MEQLFQEHAGGIEFVPEPPVKQSASSGAAKPALPTAQGMADVAAVYPSRPIFSHDFPPHKLFDGAEKISLVGLSLNMLCQSYSDKSLLEMLESGTTVECLFLDPDGKYIREREQEEGHPDNVLTTLTTLNIQTLQRVRNKLSSEAKENLRIHFYDEPIRFNIAIIDESTCVAQPYLPDARGVDSPTFVIEKKDGRPGLFDTFSQVFVSMWSRSKEMTGDKSQ